MGVNAFVVPGDVVATVSEDARLYSRHPDVIFSYEDDYTGGSDGDVVRVLPYDHLLLVLSVEKAGSAQMGHAFFVMTSGDNVALGWVRNYAVRPIACEQMPT